MFQWWIASYKSTRSPYRPEPIWRDYRSGRCDCTAPGVPSPEKATSGVSTWLAQGGGDARRSGSLGLGSQERAHARETVEREEPVRELLFFLSEPISLQLPTEDLQDYFTPEQESFNQIPEDTMQRIESDFGSAHAFK